MTETGRIASIDQFRGFAVVTMVLANFTAGVGGMPAWLKHAPDIGLTVIDLIAPLFIFAMGLTYSRSLEKRLDAGKAIDAYVHFFTRAMALIGIGFFLNAGEQWTGVSANPVNWGVLQALGMASLLVLPFLRLSEAVRIIIAIAGLVAYQYALDNYWLATVLLSPHGGMPGAFAWSAMLLLATALADLFRHHEKKRWFIVASAMCVMIGLLAMFWFPVSKNRVSSTFVLMTTGISGLVYFGFHALGDLWKKRVPFLSEWGRNPLALYLLHLVLLAIVVLPGAKWWYREAVWWLAAIEGLVMLGAVTAAAVVLDRRNVLIKL